MKPPITMRESAIALHEWFTSLIEAGFTRQEALYLAGEAVKGSSNNGNE